MFTMLSYRGSLLTGLYPLNHGVLGDAIHHQADPLLLLSSEMATKRHTLGSGMSTDHHGDLIAATHLYQDNFRQILTIGKEMNATTATINLHSS